MKKLIFAVPLLFLAGCASNDLSGQYIQHDGQVCALASENEAGGYDECISQEDWDRRRQAARDVQQARQDDFFRALEAQGAQRPPNDPTVSLPGGL